MTVRIRPAVPADAKSVGPILYRAFKTLADHHRFTPDFASPEITDGLAASLLSHPKFYGVVAEESGRIIGSNFVDLRAPVAGIGPISVDPATQNKGVGRQLMQAVMDEATRRNCPGTRLVQIAYHNRSLCLYTTMGFRSRGPLSVIQGEPLRLGFDGYVLRPTVAADTAACNDLCRNVHGMERSEEVSESIAQGSGMVVEHLGTLTGYTTGIGFFSHTVAKSNQDLMALIGAAPSFSGPGFLLPTNNHEVFAWCLGKGLRLVAQATLMSIGLYNEPDGAWLPAVLY